MERRLTDLAAKVRAYADAHFYESNMDIVAGWTDAELGAVIAEAKTARWAITLHGARCATLTAPARKPLPGTAGPR